MLVIAKERSDCGNLPPVIASGTQWSVAISYKQNNIISVKSRKAKNKKGRKPMKQNYVSPNVTFWQYLPQDICTESVITGTVYDQEEEYWSAFDEQN